MTATELYKAGKLTEAIQAISAEVRDHPTDVRRRTFLFELLCFAGDFGRAEKHLNVLAEGGADAATSGSLVLDCGLFRAPAPRPGFASGGVLVSDCGLRRPALPGLCAMAANLGPPVPRRKRDIAVVPRGADA